jgi:hypothetical protein
MSVKSGKMFQLVKHQGYGENIGAGSREKKMRLLATPALAPQR